MFPIDDKGDDDDDCVEVEGPQTSMESHVTTRPVTRFSSRSQNHHEGGIPCSTSNNESGHVINLDPASAVKRQKGKQEDGQSSMSGHNKSCHERSNANPSTRPHDDDYSSYLTLVAAISDESSDDDEINMALIASKESQQ